VPLLRPVLIPIQPIIIRPDDVLTLRGHFQDVYCGAWTHDGRFLATGSGDATATIWEIGNHQQLQHYVLDHATQQDRNGKDIATLAWNPAGTILATGCYDGSARLWTIRGELKSVLSYHHDSVFTVQFSPDGSLLLTGSSDHRVIAWFVATGERKQIFQFHHSRVLDVDWLDNQTFASCSGDTRIAICGMDRASAIHLLEGHKGEVNKIAWDMSRRLLASCSDDRTVRVWRPFERTLPIVLYGHTHHVYTIKWQPGTDRKILVSGAFDYTVRIWDVLNQSCVHVLSKHTNPIYTIGFSPGGKFFVSGGIDNVMNIWRTEDAALVASYDAGSGVFEAQWDPTGKYIAVCLSDSSVGIIATRAIAAYRERLES
jgi:transducin (beta)-like 1